MKGRKYSATLHINQEILKILTNQISYNCSSNNLKASSIAGVSMPKSTNDRQTELKARREAEGKVKRPYWATPEEHEIVKAKLAELRNK